MVLSLIYANRSMQIQKIIFKDEIQNKFLIFELNKSIFTSEIFKNGLNYELIQRNRRNFHANENKIWENDYVILGKIRNCFVADFFKFHLYSKNAIKILHSQHFAEFIDSVGDVASGFCLVFVQKNYENIQWLSFFFMFDAKTSRVPSTISILHCREFIVLYYSVSPNKLRPG